MGSAIGRRDMGQQAVVGLAGKEGAMTRLKEIWRRWFPKPEPTPGYPLTWGKVLMMHIDDATNGGTGRRWG